MGDGGVCLVLDAEEEEEAGEGESEVEGFEGEEGQEELVVVLADAGVEEAAVVAHPVHTATASLKQGRSKEERREKEEQTRQ